MIGWDLRIGDVREQLVLLPSASAQCCVTSPPYWGLRDYGTGVWDGGDDPTCDHQRPYDGSPRSTLGGGRDTIGAQVAAYKDTCGRCGARRIDRQIGLEATPDAYVENLVVVFREVRRVLAADGVLWLNLGDSYAGSNQTGGTNSLETNRRADRMFKANIPWAASGLKPKDLVGIPWRVAFALQADGWWLRSDVIWSKPNPMPESITDRPTKSHEYLFLLASSERYYYNADAIAEPLADSTRRELEEDYQGEATKDYEAAGVQNPSDVKRRIVQGLRKGDISPRQDGNPWNSNNGRGFPFDGLTRNKRTVWTVATVPYQGAHFATFPETLVEPCVLAGSRPGDVVLDPFTGSGTTGAVALRLGRSFVGVELNQAYADLLARPRLRGVAPLFTVETPSTADPLLPLADLRPVGPSKMHDTPRNDGDRWRRVDGGVAPRRQPVPADDDPDPFLPFFEADPA